jgi:hypothetical protein
MGYQMRKFVSGLQIAIRDISQQQAPIVYWIPESSPTQAKHNIIVLEGVAAYIDASRKERRTLHAVGDGTFIADGRRIDRKGMTWSKIPTGYKPIGFVQ